MDATQIFTTMLLTLAVTVTYTAADFAEVCQWETFEAKCQQDEVILMKEAHYGRMRVGRCQPRDYFVGCSADVTSIMHTRCSGLQNCSIPVPDAILFAASPCNKDLVSYLEAEYECVKVTKSNTDNCDHQILTDLSGYISKPATKSANEKLSCAQRILAQPGQTVSIYLYDFLKKQSDIEAKFYQPECTTYGYVSEDIDDGPLVKICSGEVKINELIYSSKSNVVDISLLSNYANNYLLRFEVIGCPAFQAPEYSKLKIKDNTATITCDYSMTVATFICSDNQWTGELQNCTRADVSIIGSMSRQSFSDIFANPSFTVVCIGLALSVLCSIAFLALVFTYLNSKSSKKQRVIDITPTPLHEKPIDFKNEPCIDASIKSIDQYQSVYVPIRLDTKSQYAPLHQSQANTLSTFQSCVNMPTIGDYSTTLANRVPVSQNTYTHFRPIRDCGHTMYDLAAFHKNMGLGKIGNIV